MEINRIYVFDKEPVAHAFRLTADYLGFQVTQLGSAIIAPKQVYQAVMDKTNALPAAIIVTAWIDGGRE